MSNTNNYFLGLGIFSIIIMAYGMKRYKTPLNPLTIFSLTQVWLFTITSGIIATSINDYQNESDVIKIICISGIYLIAASLPYFFNGNLTTNAYGKLFNFLGFDYNTSKVKFSSSKFLLLLLLSILSFVLLSIIGGGKFLWITNPREAYLGFRSGAGFFYASTQWLITFSMIYFIFFKKPNVFYIILLIFIYCFFLYLLGSKNNIIVLFLISIFYYNLYIKHVSVINFLKILLVMCFVFFSLLILQGSFTSFLDGLVYFQDYFDTTLQFISRFDEFGFRNGEAFISTLWFYVPRIFYIDKPYEYGFTLIHQVLFPGAAETGYTVGYLPWSLSYLDFGITGVFFEGLLIGAVQRAAYEYFIKHTKNLIAFLLAIHISIWQLWIHAPLLFVILISISQVVFLKLTITPQKYSKMK